METKVRPLLGILVTVFIAAACAGGSNTVSPSASLGNDFGTLNGATVEITAEGGFAALSSHQIVRHDDRFFVTTQRHLCATSNCPAPIDSASGTLSPAAADSLFNLIWQQHPMSLSDDYGSTRGGADMMAYTVRVAINGQTKTIRADDGTLPAAARAIRDGVRGIIEASRKK